jgi:trimethylamine--corrinoid protein Co-methyltransferase
MVYEQWEGAGAKRFEQRLQDITLKKMAHRPEPLPADIVKTLDEMQTKWEQDLSQRGGQ